MQIRTWNQDLVNPEWFSAWSGRSGQTPEGFLTGSEQHEHDRPSSRTPSKAKNRERTGRHSLYETNVIEPRRSRRGIALDTRSRGSAKSTIATRAELRVNRRQR